MTSRFYFTTILSIAFLSFFSKELSISHERKPVSDTARTIENSKIQVALLLDVSNSMDGLISQAKDQLWNMVKVIGKIRCNEARPQIEIALYEYGRSSNDAKVGYVKQITAFTNDLDKLFYSLYSLTTQGGEEYCGHVINSSLEELVWDTSATGYRAIFISGNESFLQGDISYTEACKKAKSKGIVINTIYCGRREKGVEENWNLGAECGNGNFTNIDQDATPISFPTPYDTMLIVWYEKLKHTSIPYGSMPVYDTVPTYDTKQIDKVIGWVVVKADTHLYSQSSWELTDAFEMDSSIIDDLDMKTLPDSLENKTRKELKVIVSDNLVERKRIRSEIKKMDAQRDQYIAKEKDKLTGELPKTLLTEIEKIIREQIRRFNMKIE